MCKAVEELAGKWAARSAEESRLETIVGNLKSIMKSMSFTLEQAMDVLELSDEDRSVLLKRF